MIQHVLDYDEDHFYIQHYAKRGLINNTDEIRDLKNRFKENCTKPERLVLTICPTMGCNFDCPYCFEKHIPGMMSQEVMDSIVQFVRTMLERQRSAIQRCHFLKKAKKTILPLMLRWKIFQAHRIYCVRQCISMH